MSYKTSRSAAAAGPAPGSMRNEIAMKWGKFSAAEIADIKDKDDLVVKLQSKYSFDKQHAQREVDAFAKGRQL